MRINLKILIVLILAKSLTSCWPVKKIYKRPPTVNMFYDRVVLDYALRNPELLSYAGIAEDYGIHFHNKELTDASDDFKKQTVRNFEDDLKILRSYSTANMDFEEQLSVDIMEWYLDIHARGGDFLLHEYPIDHLDGIHLALPEFMTSIHHMNTKRDARNYILRLQKFDNKFNQVIRALKVRERKGYHLPDFIVSKVIVDLEKFLAIPFDENVMFVHFEKKTNTINGLTSHKRDKMLLQVQRVLKNTVYPSYEKLLKQMKSMLPEATKEAGVWKLPDGESFYTYKLKYHTTTNISPEEVFQTGLQEVDRLNAEIRALLSQLGKDPDISIADHLRALMRYPEMLYEDSDSGRLACLQDFEVIIKEVHAQMDSMFSGLVDQEVLVKRVPKFREKTASGGYYEAPSLDGSRPGIFFVNLRDMKLLPKHAMRTLAYHETIPGHHTQVVQQMNMKDVPMFRTILPFTAYVEGWALYAERLGKEFGFLENPYDDLGRLQSEIFRAARLVVDAGLHYKRWSRQEAIDYMYNHTGLSKKEIQREVDRYIVDPGQASSYKIGELKILELRKKTWLALGEDFDIRDFHRILLENGGMPLDVLEEVIDHYIKKTRAKENGEYVKSPEQILD